MVRPHASQLLAAASLAIAIPAAAADPYQKSGNVPPVITPLTADATAKLLNGVKVPDGFDLTLYATSSAANYPVYIAAAPNGDLYVSSDGNGSLGTDPDRGRIIRLRDIDGDGTADETKVFVDKLDAPRGLIWDHDRLYVLHPPDISCFRDTDGDGTADEKTTLIKGIAFGYKDRPADHTTNDITLGIDGWIYIAGGDFGFVDAVGSDGSRLQHRGGGVIRFRPDGSLLELFSTGTRNILATPISPLLDLFARDNTNDGGGWNVRFHHFTGLEDHGYPRMYINFNDEIIQPLNDYGGGSGCGGTYLSEPGIPAEWNNAPLTCDWGSGALWHHSVEPDGATFRETAAPQPFIRITRATDATVDGMSRIYQASWRGAQFKWAGPDCGFIVQVKPTGYQPQPLPDFDSLTNDQLTALLASPSQVRSQAAQRMLLRRPLDDAMLSELVMAANNDKAPLSARVAALYAATQRGINDPDAANRILKLVPPLAKDPDIERFVLRALADLGLEHQRNDAAVLPRNLYTKGLQSQHPRTRLEALVGAARTGMRDIAPQMADLLGDPDPVVAHTAFQALAKLNASDACFAVVDSTKSDAQRRGAYLALMRMHDPAVVDGLISRIDKAAGDALAALCRLYHREGEWTGSSWGTRPDTRGPYYQPETWSESEKIARVLKSALDAPLGPHTAAFVRELQRNRIQLDGAIERMVTLAGKDRSAIPDLVAQFTPSKGSGPDVPAAAIPLLVAATQDEFTPDIQARAVMALSRVDSKEGCDASLAALARLTNHGQSDKALRQQLRQASRAFLGSPTLENHHLALEKTAELLDGNRSMWADAALLALGARTTGSPESRTLSKAAIDHGWKSGSKRQLQILNATAASDFKGNNHLILEAGIHKDPEVAKLGKELMKRFKITPPKQDNTPKVDTLDPSEVVKRVTKTKGDPNLGEQLFTRQTCSACHTVGPDEPLKGPYLGNIAQTYPRNELALNIIDPAASIAQGFATELFTLKDGSSQMGFITFEGADEVKVRNIASQEFTWKTSEIASRQRLPNSLMPPGLVNNLTIHEFASLLDYLEALAKKN